MYQNFIIPYSYEAQHVSGDTPPINRSLKLHWRVVGGRCQAQCAWQRPPTTRLTTFHVFKTRGYQCGFRLLMVDGVLLETCWASYKCGIIKLWYIFASRWIFLYELYYDARIHEQQINYLLGSWIHQRIDLCTSSHVSRSKPPKAVRFTVSLNTADIMGTSSHVRLLPPCV